MARRRKDATDAAFSIQVTIASKPTSDGSIWKVASLMRRRFVDAEILTLTSIGASHILVAAGTHC
jgi:hypothetical protein